MELFTTFIFTPSLRGFPVCLSESLIADSGTRVRTHSLTFIREVLYAIIDLPSMIHLGGFLTGAGGAPGEIFGRALGVI